MKTLYLQIDTEEDYQLFISFAKRLNWKILTEEELFESNKPDIEITSEMKTEFQRRLSSYEKSPENVYSMEDVRKELEVKLGKYRTVHA